MCKKEEPPRREEIKNHEVLVRQFDDLTPRQVAHMFALRYNVFVREQKSIFNEHDGKDFDATHLFIEENDEIIAYARIVLVDHTTASFGRVAVHASYRKQGLGKIIVRNVIDQIKKSSGISKIKIEAQEYLQNFYSGFGFVVIGEPYDDDGVMHVAMEINSL